jgi:histone H1/5
VLLLHRTASPARCPLPPPQAPSHPNATMPAATAVKSDTYSVKVTKAIAELKNRAGSSLPAITAYIQTQYGAVNKTALSQALKKGVADGSLKKVKASYKLTPKAKPAPKPKAAPKKKAAVKAKAAATPTKKASTTTKKASTAKPKKTISKKAKAAPAKKKAAPKKKPAASKKKAAAPKK